MKRNVYLHLMPLEQARKLWLDKWDWAHLTGRETIPTAQALGRVTAKPVFARYSSPGYHGAAVDGMAVTASDTFGASPERPICLRLGERAHPVNTGHRLPPDTDAVVMIEQVHQPDPEHIELRAAAFPWQHVRKVGEDIVSQEMMLPHHHQLRAADLAGLLTAGVFELEALARPRVAIQPTGSELVPWRQATETPPSPGAILETNSLFLSGLVSEAAAQPLVLEHQPDDYQRIKAALQAAVASDAHMVLLNAGASAGTRDYTVHVIAELGEVLVHGIEAMPGKPTILGSVGGKPVVGAPGYPVSAWVCFDQFVAPALALMQGQAPPRRQTVTAHPTRRMASKLGQEEFVRVHLGRVGDQVVASPLKRGAGAITTLVQADGLVRIPAASDGLEEGLPIEAEVLGDSRRVDDTLVIVGSHDVSLDILADHLKEIDTRIKVSSTHLGSLAGLTALARQNCHLAGSHLLDPASGEYNVPFLRRFLANVPCQLVTLAHRVQGFMVRPGNPQGIQTLADLTKPDVIFINRQKGSGTRVLLDHHLTQAGIDPSTIAGYDHEEYTHLAVAVQILSGGADVGLGVLAAAQALGLDFIPLATERYDLVIPQAHLENPKVRAVLEVLDSRRFRQAVRAMGGYDVTEMGKVAWRSW